MAGNRYNFRMVLKFIILYGKFRMDFRVKSTFVFYTATSIKNSRIDS